MKSCGKCGSAIPNPGPCPVCDDKPFGTPRSACQTCCDEGVIANDDDRSPWSFWTALEPPSNLAVVAGIVKPIPCPDQCARGIIATARMLKTGSPV